MLKIGISCCSEDWFGETSFLAQEKQQWQRTSRMGPLHSLEHWYTCHPEIHAERERERGNAGFLLGRRFVFLRVSCSKLAHTHQKEHWVVWVFLSKKVETLVCKNLFVKGFSCQREGANEVRSATNWAQLWNVENVFLFTGETQQNLPRSWARNWNQQLASGSIRHNIFITSAISLTAKWHLFVKAG